MSPLRRPRPRWVPLVLVLLFVVLPLVEIYVLVQVGQEIGAGWTILLLVADSVFGTWLVRREGGRAWRALRGALDSGRMPATELADGALVLVGGTLMVAPGFVTDVLGILLILPVSRPVFRRLLAAVVARRLVSGIVPGAPGVRPQERRSPGAGPGQGPVVRGEVVDDD